MVTNKKVKSPKISVNIIARNEEELITDCLISAQLLADEIVFVDMESDDNTKKVAGKYANKIYSFSQVGYVEPARNFGIRKCSGDWIFILDADERITPQLAREVRQAIVSCSPNVGAFAIPRANYNFGVWLRHGGWWPDYQVRLLRKKSFLDWPKAIHSFPKIKGRKEKLNSPFNHLANESIEEMLEKTINYSQREVKLFDEGGIKSNFWVLIKKPIGEFFRRGIKKKGFLDGTAGLIQVIYQSFSVFITYARLWEKQTKNKK